MSSMPSNVHSPSACSTAHAITYVPTLPLHPIHSLTRRKPDTGDRPYKCQYCGDQFARRYASLHFPLSNHLIPWLLATFSLATSINATPTRSLSQTASPAVAEKALLPHLARPHPSRPVTSVSSPVFHVMGPTLAVRTPPQCLPSSAHPFLSSRHTWIPLPSATCSKMHFPQVSLYVCQISPANCSERSRSSYSPLPFLFFVLAQYRAFAVTV